MLEQLIGMALHEGVAAVLIAALLWMFLKTPRAGLALVLILAVLEGSREWTVPLGTSLGPINVNWADVATALMGGCRGGARWLEESPSSGQGRASRDDRDDRRRLGLMDAPAGHAAGRELLEAMDFRDGGSVVRR